MPLGVPWSKRMRISENAHQSKWLRQQESAARRGCGRQIRAPPASALPLPATARYFPLSSTPPPDFQKPWQRASGYRETPMRRCVCPARFRLLDIGTNRELPCAYPPSHRSFLTLFFRFIYPQLSYIYVSTIIPAKCSTWNITEHSGSCAFLTAEPWVSPRWAGLRWEP